MTGDLGLLYPVGCIEVLPGDYFQHQASALVRMSPMAAPIMHPIRVSIRHFFVATRLCVPKGVEFDWEQFITGGPNNDYAVQVPTIKTTGQAGDLLDHLGIPTVADMDVSAFPVVAFNKIYNEWFRDQDLVTPREDTDVSLVNVSWDKDYFTTARPFSQKGPDISLPIGTESKVFTKATSGQAISVGNSTGGDNFMDSSGANLTVGSAGQATQGLFADLSTATAAKINDIRRAFALQRFAEVRARFGSRYAEYLRYLGVNPQDERLQRPEYLGGGTSSLAVSEVLQTANEAGSSTPRFGVGDMYGHGVSSSRSNAYRKRFREHGYVLSLLYVRPKHLHTQGIDRHWLRQDREDYWQRELEHIGQQEVLQREVYAEAGNAETVFGYSDRYAEYRSARSRAVSEFRTDLDFWHLGRKFSSAPVLNASYVNCDVSKRIFNEQTKNSLWVAVNHRIRSRRLVSRDASGRII